TQNLEDHPRTFVHLNRVQLHFLAFRGHLELGIGADVGTYRDADFVAGTAQDHRRQAVVDTKAATDAAQRTKGQALAVYKTHASDVTGAQGRVPVGFELT